MLTGFLQGEGTGSDLNRVGSDVHAKELRGWQKLFKERFHFCGQFVNEVVCCREREGEGVVGSSYKGDLEFSLPWRQTGSLWRIWLNEASKPLVNSKMGPLYR